MKVALIVATIFVFIVLAIGFLLTLSAANSMNKNYSGTKSFSSLLWAYLLAIPIIIIVIIIAIVIFI